MRWLPRDCETTTTILDSSSYCIKMQLRVPVDHFLILKLVCVCFMQAGISHRWRETKFDIEWCTSNCVYQRHYFCQKCSSPFPPPPPPPRGPRGRPPPPPPPLSPSPPPPPFDGGHWSVSQSAATSSTANKCKLKQLDSRRWRRGWSCSFSQSVIQWRPTVRWFDGRKNSSGSRNHSRSSFLLVRFFFFLFFISGALRCCHLHSLIDPPPLQPVCLPPNTHTQLIVCSSTHQLSVAATLHFSTVFFVLLIVLLPVLLLLLRPRALQQIRKLFSRPCGRQKLKMHRKKTALQKCLGKKARKKEVSIWDTGRSVGGKIICAPPPAVHSLPKCVRY